MEKTSERFEKTIEKLKNRIDDGDTALRIQSHIICFCFANELCDDNKMQLVDEIEKELGKLNEEDFAYFEYAWKKKKAELESIYEFANDFGNYAAGF